MGFQKNKSIEDCLKVLMAIAGELNVCGSRELARRLDMEPTRVNRFLKTLKSAGYVEQDEAHRYYAGSGMKVLAAQSLYGSRLLRGALPVIEQIWPFPHVVALGVLFRDQVSYLFHAVPGMTVAEGVGRMKTFPATSSSIGLLLLALQPPALVEELYFRCPSPIAGIFHTYAELTDCLALIREQGYAMLPSYDDKGYTAAVPVGEPVIGALAFAGFSESISSEVLEQLQRRAEEITENIRYGFSRNFSISVKGDDPAFKIIS